MLNSLTDRHQLTKVWLIVTILVWVGPDQGLEARPALTSLHVLEVKAVAGLVGGLCDWAHPGVPVALLHF